jgi:catechol 2,3-dioxygenase-like lactoylglutathione lyase family enzyme
MAVKRIVTNIASAQVDAARSFYGNVLGLEVITHGSFLPRFQALTV